MKATLRGWRGLFTWFGTAMLLIALVKELRLPREQRTWRGLLFGVVPYDLRPPTLGRYAHTMWNPEERSVIVPTAFGVGWTVNAAALFKPLGGRSGDTSA